MPNFTPLDTESLKNRSSKKGVSHVLLGTVILLTVIVLALVGFLIFRNQLV